MKDPDTEEDLIEALRSLIRINMVLFLLNNLDML
jgi:hypothetical protein